MLKEIFKKSFFICLCISISGFCTNPSQTEITIGNNTKSEDGNNGVAPYFYGDYDAAGYSDWIYYGKSDIHEHSYHELLSGEWAAAVYYDGISSGNQGMWLTDLFEYPNWQTNSDFEIYGIPSAWAPSCA
ncbi:hypothetical protein [Sedimentisphaera salicampi]|uniref:hypothetical protein n=1 Tax=Sedimentisphaera salicampi TaxID=1941349 RepID=UPI000B9B01A0|nr:hypothetical protein [Sedimentisphaera salicampi]OXU14512.1 hypothetical protein SMSP1_01823 [Sedimentisphaera salicampi]